MQQAILEKAKKLLPDYRTYDKDTINISIIKLDPYKHNEKDIELNYCYVVKFKKIYDGDLCTGWDYVSMSIASKN